MKDSKEKIYKQVSKKY